MAAMEIPVRSHYKGEGVQELRNLCWWKQATPPGGVLEAVFWYGSGGGDKRLYFQDDAGVVKVPRLDRNEGLTGQWSFAPGSAQAPFTLGTLAQGQKVTGLDADLVDDMHAATNPTANTIAARDSNGRLKVADPTVLTEVVNVQYLDAALAAAELAASQITSGILSWALGGTSADLSSAGQQGGLVWKGASALQVTGSLSGVLISNGIAGPAAQDQLAVTLGGTGGSSPDTARQNLQVLSGLETYGVSDGREPRVGVKFDGTTGFKLLGLTGIALGTSDWSCSVIFKLDDLTMDNTRTLWVSHVTGANRMGLQVWSTTQVSVFVIDGSGVRTDYAATLPAETPLVAGERYHLALTVSRSGNATFYLNGTNVGSVAIGGASGIDIGSGNVAGWGSGYKVNGVIYALRVFNSALDPMTGILNLTKFGYPTMSGVVLDMEFESANPAVYNLVRDRSGSTSDAVMVAGVAVTTRRMHTNTETLLVSSLGGSGANAVVYAQAGGLMAALAPNAAGTAKVLSQASGNAPAWLDLFGGSNTWAGTQTFNSGVTFAATVVVQTPTLNSHAATKAYVDSVAAGGLRPLTPVRVATTANITLSGTQTIDGVAVIAGDRVLVKNQSTASQNGIYDVASGAWSRSSDANTAGAVTKGAYVFVSAGTTNIGSSWYQNQTVTTLGTDPLTWSLYFQGVAYANGTGLTLSGVTFAVDTSFSPTWTGGHTFQPVGGVIAINPFNTSAGNTTELRFLELAANGSNFVGFKAPDNIASNRIWTLPSADGSLNYYLKTNGSGALSFAQIASTEINNSSFLTGLTGTANRLTVSSGLNPTVDIAATYVGQASITTLGTVTTGTWNASVIASTKGGTGQAAWSVGDIVYSPFANQLAGLSISGTANKMLQSNGTTPSWSNYTMPASVAVNQLLIGSGANVVSALSTVASRVLSTDGSGNVSWANTLPAGLTISGDTNNKVAKFRVFNVGDGSSTIVTLTHNFGTTDVAVQVIDVATGKRTDVADTRSTANTVDLEFDIAPALNSLRCLVWGAA